MRALIATIALLCFHMVGCGNEDAPERTGIAPSADEVTALRIRAHGATVIETPEIVRILEQEPIAFVFTSHAQWISIELEDGRKYGGKYAHGEAGKYADDPQLSDILNLVMHIRESRPPEEVKDWQILCE